MPTTDRTNKLTLGGVFLAGMGGFTLVLRRRDEQVQLRPFDLAMLGLSVYRTGRLLAYERVAAPIREHEPDLVLHGHAHAGTFEARIGASPVYNVSVPVMGRDFWLLELASLGRPTTPIH